MNYINGNNFSNLSNFVFSEIVRKDYFYNVLDHKNLIVLQETSNLNGEHVWYINPEIRLKENDIIFSHTEVVEYLFKFLSNSQRIKNLKLITHQSDRPVDEKLWTKKPKSISEWYSTNVIYNTKNLFSIPLGLGNDYLNTYKNHIETINNLLEIKTEKKNSAFLNFRINTNTVERLKTLFSLKNKSWIELKTLKQDPEQYLIDMNSCKYTICPWGNGYDTHRIWESIYLKSIPVTRNHIAYRQFQDLPIIFIENWKKLDLDYLEEEASNLNYYNLEKLDLDYWENSINKVKIDSKNTYVKILNQNEISKMLSNIMLSIEKGKRMKRIRTFIGKFHYLKLRHYFTVKKF